MFAPAPSCTAAPFSSIWTSAASSSSRSSSLSSPALSAVTGGGGGNFGNSANGGNCAGSVLSGELIPVPGGATRSGWVSFQSSLPSLSSSISEKMILRRKAAAAAHWIQWTGAKGDRNPLKENGMRNEPELILARLHPGVQLVHASHVVVMRDRAQFRV